MNKDTFKVFILILASMLVIAILLMNQHGVLEARLDELEETNHKLEALIRTNDILVTTLRAEVEYATAKVRDVDAVLGLHDDAFWQWFRENKGLLYELGGR